MWNRLDRWQNNIDAGINRESYFTLCEQIGEDPNEDKLPPEIHNFPVDVQKAISVFNKLGDRVFPDIGYVGKDYTSLPIHIEVEEILEKKLFLETLLRLDAKIITKSAEAMKQQREKLKKK